MSVIALVQARMGSTRLPNKVLMDLEGKSILGIMDIEEEVRKSFDSEPLEYKVGTMIELPAAALQADSIARYAEFFSFGTNDLTQTTNGLSRDDFNSFFIFILELIKSVCVTWKRPAILRIISSSSLSRSLSAHATRKRFSITPTRISYSRLSLTSRVKR